MISNFVLAIEDGIWVCLTRQSWHLCCLPCTYLQGLRCWRNLKPSLDIFNRYCAACAADGRPIRPDGGTSPQVFGDVHFSIADSEI